MRITPLDIRKQEFKRGLRGYDPEEVQSFLQMVSTQWDELQAEHRRLEQKVAELEGKLQHYAKVEEALQEALRTARESSRQAVETAKHQGQNIVRDAEQQAEQIRRGAEQESKAMRREAADIRSKRNEILARLRAFLHAEMELLARYESDHPEDKDATEAVRMRAPGQKAEASKPQPSSWQEPAPKAAPKPSSEFLYYDDLPGEPRAVEPKDQRESTSGSGSHSVSDWEREETSEPAPWAEASAASPGGSEDEAEEERDEPRPGTGWVVRPVISAPAATKPAASEESEGEEMEEEQENQGDTFNISASTDEIERIRRILKDLE